MVDIPFTKNKQRKLIFLVYMVLNIVIITLTACSTQQGLPLKSTSTPEIEKIVINGPPEPPAGEVREGIEDLGGLQKIAQDGSSLYYYENGKRIPLTLSLNWITIQFKTDILSEREAALQNIASLAYVDQRVPLTESGILLIPLQSGLSNESLISNINLLRIDSEIYSQVNPSFVMDGVEKAITDQIVVVFSSEKDMGAIKTINDEMKTNSTSEQEMGSHTYLLSIDSESPYDAITTANLYIENGYAVQAYPVFIEIKK